MNSGFLSQTETRSVNVLRGVSVSATNCGLAVEIGLSCEAK